MVSVPGLPWDYEKHILTKIPKRDIFPVYWGGGGVPGATGATPREIAISGTSKGSAWPIPFGAAKITGDICGYRNRVVTSWGETVAVAYRIADADRRLNIETSTAAGRLWINGQNAPDYAKYRIMYDGTQLTVDTSMSYGTSDWDAALYGTCWARCNYLATDVNFPGIPTVEALIKTSVWLDWTEYVVSAAGHQNDLIPSDGYDFIGTVDVKIVGVGTGGGGADEFQWRENGGAWSGNVDCATSDIDLGTTGIDIQFGATTGHSLNDTWTIRPLSNPFMAAYFYLTSDRYGPNYDKSVFHQASWTASANVCDVDQGTDDPLWSINGYVSDEFADDILQELMNHCFGYLWKFGGQIHAGLDTTKTVDCTIIQTDFIEGGEPTWSRMEKRQLLNRCITWYYDTSNNYADGSREWHTPDLTPTDIRDTQQRLRLCNSGSMAQRWAKQRVLKDYYEDILMKCTVHPGAGDSNGRAIDLGPGDRIDVTSNTGLSSTPFRVISSVYDPDRGTVSIEARKYSASCIASGSTDENDPYDFPSYDPPDTPTAAQGVLIERGDWTENSLVPDPDDIDADWTLVDDMTSSASGNNTILIGDFLGASKGGRIQYVFTPGSATKLFFHLAFAWPSTSTDQGIGWYFEYVTDNGTQASKAIIAKEKEDEWFRLIMPDVDVDGAAAWHRVQIRATAGANFETIRVRRVHVLDRTETFNPALAMALKYYWTEDASAGDTVSFYQFGFANSLNNFIPVKQTPVNTTEIYIPIFVNGDIIDYGIYTSGTSSPSYVSRMMTLGLDGTRIDFPALGTSITSSDWWDEAITATALKAAQLADESSLLRSDASDSITDNSTLTVTSGSEIDIASGADLDVNGDLLAGDATSVVLPTANISGAGAASGLNADLLDGLHSAGFIRANASDNLTNSSTLTVDSGSEIDVASGATLDGNGTIDFTDGSTTLGETILADAGELTIAGDGSVTVTGAFHTLDTAGDAASDNLDAIGGLAEGQVVVFGIENNARDVVVRDGAANIYLNGNSDVTLSNTLDRIAFMGTSGGSAVMLWASLNGA